MILMENENRIRLIRIIAASVLLAAVTVFTHFTALPVWGQQLLFLVPYLIAGYDVLWEMIENISHGEVFDEDFLMGIATIGALCIGFLPNAETQFPEAVFVMIFFQVGELFEEIAEGRSRRSISQLMDIRPDTANVERDGKILTVRPDEVAVGETIVIRPGEKVPMDGVVLEGNSSLNTVALTGESVPRDVGPNETILSGCVNLSGVVRVKTTKAFGESTAAKILNLVENAGENKAKSENFITKFARYYTPAVVFAAVVLAFLPPLVSGNFLNTFSTWLYRALTFLVVSCPCAFVISVPLTFFGGIGGASKNGILVKGSNYMEALSKTGTVVFDKTGTLTKGVFQVTAVHPDKITPEELLHMAAHVERFSTHPIAVSLRQAYAHEKDSCEVTDIHEIVGEGVSGRINGRIVDVGNTKLMDNSGAKWKQCTHVGTIIHVSIDGEYAGHIVISDKIKDDSEKAVADLKAGGVEKVVMLTGDREEVGKDVAEKLKLDEYHAELMPEDKVRQVEDLIAKKTPGKTLAFVGDGINDAPVLARADVGIAMGAMGSDAAVEAADVVLMDDKPSKIALAIRIARRTLTIAKENIALAMIVKLTILVLAVFGLASMWLAVFGDVGVTVIAVLNAMRALYTKKTEQTKQTE
jgi:Cd2+/Zn2+-exporting ATPase